MGITYTIGLKVDDKELKKKLDELRSNFKEISDMKIFSEEMNKAAVSAQVLENAIKKASTKNGTSFVALNAEIKKAGLSMEEMVDNFIKVGDTKSANILLQTFATADRSVLALNKHLAETARVML